MLFNGGYLISYQSFNHGFVLESRRIRGPAGSRLNRFEHDTQLWQIYMMKDAKCTVVHTEDREGEGEGEFEVGLESLFGLAP